VSGGWKYIVADALHVVAGIQNNAAGRGIEANPFHVLAVEYLQAFHFRGRKKGKQVNVLVTQHSPGAGSPLFMADRRIIIQAESEIGGSKFFIVSMRIAPQVSQQALHHRQNQFLLFLHQVPEPGFKFRARPKGTYIEALTIVHIECTAAKNPAFHQVGVNDGGFPDRKITLVYRTGSFREIALAFIGCKVFKKIDNGSIGVFIERSIHTVSGQDGKTDTAQGIAQFPGKLFAAIRSTAEEHRHVTAWDFIFFIELIDIRFFGKLIFLLLAHLFESAEILVDRIDALVLVALILVTAHYPVSVL